VNLGCRTPNDLSEGYRDCAPGQPRPISFAAKSTNPVGPPTVDGRLSDKAAHDIFVSGLRGKLSQDLRHCRRRKVLCQRMTPLTLSVVM